MSLLIARVALISVVVVAVVQPVSGCRQRSHDGTLSDVVDPADEEAKIKTLREKLQSLNLTTDCPQGRVCATILQMNDIYEIGAVSGGKAGGLDRVAKLREMLGENRDAGSVITVLAGDFLNPSGLGTIKEDGKAWSGRQMVSVLKAVGLDLVIFGNHEFDLKKEDLQARLDETVTADAAASACAADGAGLRGSGLTAGDFEDAARWRKDEEGGASKATKTRPKALHKATVAQHRSAGLGLMTTGERCFPEGFAPGRKRADCFEWIASNVSAAPGSDVAFQAGGMAIPKARVITLQRGDMRFRIGLLGLTSNKNQKYYLQYRDVEPTAKMYLDQLRQGFQGSEPADAVVAVTHINREDDIALLKAVPGIELSIGGHDHKNSIDCVGDKTSRCVAKADANARTVYIHRLSWDPNGTKENRLLIKSDLLPIDESLPSDSNVTALVDCWFKRAEGTMASTEGSGDASLQRVIARVPEAFDGTEAAVRNKKGSNLTALYTKAMLDTGNGVAANNSKFVFAFVNGGSFRIDDMVGPGAVTFYETVRVLPFGGNLATASIKISQLAKILRRSWKDVPVGSGAVIHLYPRVAAMDAAAASITEAGIAAELKAAAHLTEADPEVNIVASEFLIKIGDDLTPEEKAYFKLTSDPLAIADMRKLLVATLGKLYPP